MGSGNVKSFNNEEENLQKNIQYLSKVNPNYIEYYKYLEKNKIDIKKKHIDLLLNGKYPNGTIINKSSLY
jgi:deoxyadenosine/deoxycytidine kinase